MLHQVINKQYQDQLEDIMSSLAFPWFANKWVDDYSFPFSDLNVRESFQFSHTFYDNGASMPTYNLVQPLLDSIIKKAGVSRYTIVRVKANLTTQHQFGNNHYQVPHVDTDPPSRTFVYYVNDSDGDTILFNERLGDKFDKFTVKERCSPKKGDVYSFDGSHYHAGQFPTDKYRMVINFVIR